MSEQPENPMTQQPKAPKRSVGRGVFLAFLVLVAVLALWHVVLPLFGITIALTAGTLGTAIVTTIIVACVGTILFYVFAGVGALLIGLLSFGWLIVVIVLFPVLLPLFLPILFIMLLINLFRRK